MKVKLTVCPKCNKETKVVTEEDNLHNYSEEIIYKKCKDCPTTPEGKLLNALFRVEEEHQWES